MSDNDKMREAFEKWYLMQPIAHKSHIVRISNGHYFGAHTETAWRAWQAAQSEQSVPVVDIDATGFCYNGVHMAPVVDNITATELDALRKDAKRWRVVKQYGYAMEEAIDAAIAAEGEKE